MRFFSALWLFACLSLLACHGEGFAVAVHVSFDSNVTDDEVASVRSFSFTASGDESYTTTVTLDRAARRTETLLYYPRATTRNLTLAAVAEAQSQATIATGSTPALVLVAGKTTDTELDLTQGLVTDAGVPDAGGDGAVADANPDAPSLPLQLLLEGTPTYPTSKPNPTAIAAVDVNGDGNVDVVTLAGSAIDVRLSSANGTLGALISTNVGTPLPYLATGDFDHDGHIDVAVASATVVQIWRGDGTGAFTKGAAVDEGITPIALAAADFDGDLRADLVIVGATSNAIVYGADSSKVFQFTAANGNTQSSVAVGDINGDKQPDLVILQPAQYGVEVVLDTNAKTARTFAAPIFDDVTSANPGFTDQVVLSADVDGDGLDDIAVSTDGAITFCYTHTDGTCDVAGGYNEDSRSDVKLVDLDGDHHADLVTSHDYTNQGVGVALYVAAGPMFGDELRYAAGTEPGPLAVADLDHNGQPDYIVANVGGQSVSVVFATTPVHGPIEVLVNNGSDAAPIVADVNADGFLDLVIGQTQRNFVSVVFGNGDGTFAPFEQSDLLVVPDTDEVDATALGDVDADGSPDLVVAGQGTIGVFSGSKGGAFASPTRTTYDATNAARALAIGDLNHDGKPEIVMVRANDSAVYVFYGNGTTTPAAPTVLTVDAQLDASSLAIGDIDGDLLPDLVVASAGHNGVIVFKQTSAGALMMQPALSVVTGQRVVRLVDLDGNGTLDLVAAGSGGLVTELNDGKGVFTFSQKLVAAAAVDDVVAVDLTNDGKPELVSAVLLTHQIVAYPNGGSSFGAGQPYTVGSMVNTVFLASGDFDRDGRIDLVMASDIEGISRIRNISK